MGTVRERRGRSLPEAFARQAARHPEAVALTDADQSLTFGEVVARVDRLAARLVNRLAALGTGRRAGHRFPAEPRIALLAEPRAETVVALLAILDVGAAYVPLDPAHPRRRHAFLLADSGACLLVGRSSAVDTLAAECTDLGIGRFDLEEGLDDLTPRSGGRLSATRRPGRRPIFDPRQLAYVIYTSGSTGRPKGVAVSHGAVLHLVAATAEEHPCGPGESTTLLHSLAFDLSVWELWRPLFGGGRLVVIPESARRSGKELLALLEDEAVSQLNLTPSALRLLLAAGFSPGRPASLRWLGIGGEALELERLRPWLEDPGQRVRLVGLYGPTEATVWAASHGLGDEELGPVGGPSRPPPLGRPLPGWTLELEGDGADDDGEVVLGGVALARGYSGRPALTAERFVPDPAGNGARRYLTGDHGRRRDDGVVEFLGRLDQQIKLRGFRIELGEIEARLATHPALAEAAVGVDREAGDEPLLVAHLVLAEGADAGPGMLGDFLAEHLPAIEIPGRWLAWPRLPRLTSGKVDRRRLAAWRVGEERPEALKEPAGESEAPPLTSTGSRRHEALLAALWGDLLGCDPGRLGAGDHFFRLGGHSLLAMRLLADLAEETGVEIAPADFFRQPTLGALSGALRRASAAAVPDAVSEPRSMDGALPEAWTIDAPDVASEHPATPQQLAFWLAQQRPAGERKTAEGGGHEALHIVSAWGLEGALDPGRFVVAWCRVLARHPGLRTTFRQHGGLVVQRIAPPGGVAVGGVPGGFGWVELGALPIPRSERLAEELLERHARRPFALDRGPLWRWLLLSLGGGHWRLQLVVHHIAGDGWSEEVVLEEVAKLYSQVSGSADLPPPGPGPGRGELAAGATGASRDELAEIRGELENLPGFELPTDRPPSLQPTGRAGRRRGGLAPDEVHRLARLARSRGTTPAVVVLALVQTFLARLAGVDSLVVGWPDARRSASHRRSVGCFADLLVVRGDLAAGARESGSAASARWVGLEGAIERLASRVLALLARPALSFADWRRAAGEEATDSDRRHPVVRVVLAPQDTHRSGEATIPGGASSAGAVLGLVGVETRALDPCPPATRFELELHTRAVSGGGLAIDWIFPTDRCDATTVERWRRAFETLVATSLANPERPLHSLPLLGLGERHQVTHEWGVGRPGSPPGPGLWRRVLEQARRLGDRPALVAESVSGALRTLSWKGLVAKASNLAALLRRQGLGDEEPVALVFDRGPEMVVAMLGVSAAGGVYVPIDPAWPAARRHQVSVQAGARRLLATRRTRRRLALGRRRSPEASCEESPIGCGRGGERPVQGAGDQLLAYLMFTSGSTGKPKGVAVEQRGIVRLLDSTGQGEGLGAILHLAPATFDASTVEIWGALLAGRRLVLAPPKPLSIAEIGTLVQRHRVTTLFLTTPLAHQAAREPLGRFRGLRHLLVGGEVMRPEAARRLRRELGPRTTVCNVYGPTENTVFSTFHALGDEEERPRVPIGRSLAGDGVWVLDAGLRLLPVGWAGQIALSGPGLARGYWRSPAATAERFVPHPWTTEGGQRLYLTGDRGRWLADGALDFLARLDSQVKIRGMRVEPLETEHRLASLSGVSAAAVVAIRPGGVAGPGTLRLVAFVVLDEPAPEPWWYDLAERLAERLPEVQRPGEWRRLDALPTTESGKIDRRRLVAEAGRRPVGEGATGEPSFEAEARGRRPQGTAEEGLASIWSAVLGGKAVLAGDAFFALGGDSLTATRVVAEVWRRFGHELPLARLFENPTLAELALEIGEESGDEHGAFSTDGDRGPMPASRALGGRATGTDAPPAGAGWDEGPVSSAQRRLWLLSQLEPADPAFVVTFAWGILGPLELGCLGAALGDVARRHEGLRTTFVERDGEPRQCVHGMVVAWAGRWGMVDLGALGRQRRVGEALALAHRAARRPLALDATPPWRLIVSKLAPEDYHLLLVGHHVVFDGAAVGLFCRELGRAYRARRAGRSILREAPSRRPIDWAREQRRLQQTGKARLEAYWRRRLADLPPLDLPVDRMPGSRRSPATAGHRVGWRLEADTALALERLVRASGASPWVGLLACFFLLLERLGANRGAAVLSPEEGGSSGSLAGEVLACRVELLVLRPGSEGRRAATFAALLEACRGMALEALDNRGLPFEELVAGSGVRHDPRRHPLAQASLAWHGAAAPVPDFVGTKVEPLERRVEHTHLDLEVHLWPVGGGGIEGHGIARRDLLDATTAERWARLFERLAEQAVGQPGRRLDQLEVLSASELHQLTVEWNDTARAFHEQEPGTCTRGSKQEPGTCSGQEPGTLDALVMGRVEVRRARVVLENAEGKGWTGDRLLAEVETLASTLVEGVSRAARAAGGRDGKAGRLSGRVVAVCTERGPRQLVAFLAILRSGGAYLPLDPSHPPARLADQLATAEVVAIVGEGRHRGSWAGERPWIGLVEGAASRAPRPGGCRRSWVPTESAAYVLHTSGSSGLPKAVVISHRAIVHHMLWIEGALALGPADRLLHKTPAIFDAAVWEPWLPLMVGARLVLAPPGVERDAEALVELLVERRITVLQVVPSQLRMLLEVDGLSRARRLRLVVCGGEALGVDLLRRFDRIAPPGARLINVYGPTEATIHASWEPRPEVSDALARGVAPLGRPIANTRLFVLDDDLGLVPPGVEGRLMIEGPGLAQGYLGGPAASAPVFLPNPFGGPGSRLYDTGDRARRRGDGRIDFLGRGDRQLKWRGVRIEPGEVETALETHPAVRQAVVVLLEGDEPSGEPTRGATSDLVAWLLPTAEVRPGLGELRRHLRGRLPESLLPGRIGWLDSLPTTVGGKIDRRRLSRRRGRDDWVVQGGAMDGPWDGSGVEAARVFPGPADPVAAEVARLWWGVLDLESDGVARMGPTSDDRDATDASFFELGGHSLLATRLLARIRKLFGAAPSLAELFAHPTLGELVELVRRRRAGEARQAPVLELESGTRKDGGGPEPLTLAQRRLWFLHRLEPSSTAYGMPFGWRLRGGLDTVSLATAMARVLGRHPALRSRFPQVGGEAWQVAGPLPDAVLPRIDLAHLSSSSRLGEARDRLLRGWVARPFELELGPPFRAALVRCAPGEHLLLIDAHHIAFDGWSAGLLAGELGRFYTDPGAATASPAVPAPGVIARAQQRWLGHPSLETQRLYWQRRLVDLPTLELPRDRPFHPSEGRPAGGIDLAWGEATIRRIEALAQRRGATLFMVLLASLAAVLRRHGAGDDLPIGSPVAGRRQVELEGAVGFFVNLLVLRLQPSGSSSFTELLDSARRAALEAWDHQDLPFERVVEALAPGRGSSPDHPDPLVQVTLALQNVPRAPLVLEGLECETLPLEPPDTRFELEIYLWHEADALVGRLVYRRDLFDVSTIRRLASSWRHLLEQVVENPDLSLDALGRLGPSERHQLLVEWGGPRFELDAQGVIERFFEHAQRRPAAVAIRHRSHRWSYGELARHAGVLARRLRRLGVGPEIRVALYLEPSPELVQAMLAILLAGGAYVPLDPAQDSERSARILADSGAALLISTPRLEPPGGAPARIDLPLDADRANALDTALEGGRSEPGSEAQSQGHDQQLAYVIYTSGSTGRPKGVGIPRRALDRLVGGACRPFEGRPDDVWSLFHSAAFDFSVWEIWGALSSGGCVAVVDEAERRDGEALLDRLASDGVTVLDLTPSALALLLDAGLATAPPPSLRWVLFGGERLDPSRLAPFLREGASSSPRWANLYGITETTVHTTFHPLGAADVEAARQGRASPVGRPLVDGVARVVSAAGRLLPMGVVGELWVGGPGVARGYLGQPAKTGERFVPDPWSGRSGERLYRSGDRARWRGDGGLEILGRVDDQVQLRGHRIEPGEIEALLRTLPGVAEAAVVPVGFSDGSPDGGGEDGRLLAAVVPAASVDRTSAREEVEGWSTERVDRWRQVYDTLYRQEPAKDPRFDIRGWNSGLTGESLGERTMRRWHRLVLGRLRLLRGGRDGWRIWEIGCGSGLLVHALADEADRYLATDLSPATLETLGQRLAERGLHHVELEERRADDFRGIAPASFDLVILSSVIQYFTGAEQLATVLRGALRATSPGGRVFVGDVRNLATFEPFCEQRLRVSGEGWRGSPGRRAGRWTRELEGRERWLSEEELLVHPAFFPRVARSWPELARARVLSRPGRGELFRHRYDVVLERADEVVGRRTTGASPEGAVAAPLSALVNDPLAGERRHRRRRQLRHRLLAALPGYMVPAELHLVDSLPLTSHGKVDRRTLAVLSRLRSRPSSSTGIDVSPSDEGGELGTWLPKLLGLWRELLDQPGAGPDDGFFELGGHSLLATRLVARAREVLGREVPLAWLFELRTPRALAEHLVSTRSSDDGEPRRPPLLRRRRIASGPERLPLAPSQERLWFLERLDPGAGAYGMPLVLRLRGALCPERLRRALFRVVAAHEGLRATFDEGSEGPRQWFHPPNASSAVELARVDLRPLGPEPARVLAGSLARLLSSLCHRGFELGRRWPWRAALVELGGGEWVFAWVTHHLVFDGLSEGLLLRQLEEEYAQGLASEATVAPPAEPTTPGLQFGDYVLWQRAWLGGETLDRQLAFWRRQLAGVPRLELPLDHPRPPRRSSRGSSISVDLGTGPWAAVAALARGHGTSRFVVLLAAFFVHLGRLCAQRDLVVGTPVANRNGEGLEGVVGCFVNTLALRPGRLDEGESFATWIGRLASVVAGALAHQETPVHQLVAALDPVRDLARLPLVEAVFALQETGEGTLCLEGCETEATPPDFRRTPFDLMVTARPRPLRDSAGAETLVIEWRYASLLFDRTTARRHAHGFVRLLAALLAEPTVPLFGKTPLAPAERHQLLVEWPVQVSGASKRGPAADEAAGWLRRLLDTLHSGGGAPALRCEGEVVSGQELATGIRHRAHGLWKLGACRGGGDDGRGFWAEEPRVGVLLERSPRWVETLLAVMAVGGVAVPLDGEHPEQRLALQLEESGARLLIGEAERARRLGRRSELSWIEVGELERSRDEGIGRGPYGRAWPPPPPHPARLAQVLFTSGSTGRPKAVAVGHGAIGVYLGAALERYPLGGRGVAFFTSTAVDLTLTSWLLPLVAEEVVEILPRSVSAPRSLATLKRSGGWSLLKMTPSHLELLALDGAADDGDEHGARLARGGPLGTLVLGGEPLGRRAVELARRLFPGARIFNEYGPSETTVGSSVEEVVAIPVSRDRIGGLSEIPIGRALAGDHLLVLDRWLRPVPLGGVGQLFVGGRGLARGYLGRPALTASCFVPDPTVPGGRLYATGDRGRWLADGRLEMLGRLDDQLSVRGHRLEPGEVESVLEALPGIERAAAVMVGDRLGVALVAGTGVRPTVSMLRRALLEQLPSASIPSSWSWLKTLPRTASGKVDRRAVGVELAAREERAASDPGTGGTRPDDPLIAEVAALWGEVLGLARVPTDRGFFELGGHSLAAMRLVLRLRNALGFELSLHRLLAGITVEELADEQRSQGREIAWPGPPTRSRSMRGASAPLTFGQLRVLEWRGAPLGHPGNHILLARALRGPLDVASLGAAWRSMVGCHGALRTVFETTGKGTPRQRVVAIGSDMAGRLSQLPLLDLSTLGGGVEPSTGELALLRRFAFRAFDLAKGPVARILLLRRAPEDHVLLVVFHHLVMDGESVALLEEGLVAAYGALRQGLPGPGPGPGTGWSLIDFARWQHGATGETGVARRGTGRDSAASRLRWPERGGFFQRGAARRGFEWIEGAARWGGWATGGWVAALSQEEHSDLLALCRSVGTSLQTVLLAALARALVSAVAGGKGEEVETLYLGTTLSNRHRSALRHTVGMVVDQLVLELEPKAMRGGDDPRAWIDVARQALVKALARHETIDGRQRNHASGAACRAVLNLQSEYQPSPGWPGLEAEAQDLGIAPHAKRDMTLQAHASEGGFNFGLVFPADRVTPELAEEVLAAVLDQLRVWMPWARPERTRG